MTDKNVSLTDEENQVSDELEYSYQNIRYITNKDWGLISVGTECRTNKKVAIKSYDKDQGHDKEYETEKKILENLDSIKEEGGPSDRIVKLLKIVERDNYSHNHIIMEWCDIDLYDHMTRATRKLIYSLNENGNENKQSQSMVFEHREAVRKISIEIIDGVAWLHSNGICHCDLSLENVMMHRDKHIRIIDFGLSKQFDEKWPKDMRRVGKTEYTSYECFDERAVDPRDNDMWSIGVMIWRMLFWRPPWHIPFLDDNRFNVIFTGGTSGIKRILALFSREVPKSQEPRFKINKVWRDFFAKIFCHEKHRLIMDKIKKHPIYTSRNENPTPIISPKVRAQAFDKEIESAIHKSRYDTTPHKIPERWDSAFSSEKQKMVSYLAEKDCLYAQKNKPNITVLDIRLVEKFQKKFHLELEEAKGIILHLWFLSDKSHHPHWTLQSISKINLLADDDRMSSCGLRNLYKTPGCGFLDDAKHIVEETREHRKKRIHYQCETKETLINAGRSLSTFRYNNSERKEDYQRSQTRTTEEYLRWFRNLTTDDQSYIKGTLLKSTLRGAYDDIKKRYSSLPVFSFTQFKVFRTAIDSNP